jgi:putative transposase
VSDKYAFIAAEYDRHEAEGVADAPPLTRMLSWLGVSKSGFYEWRDRAPSASEQRREQLKAKITEVFDKFGAPMATGASTPSWCGPVSRSVTSWSAS